MDETDIYTYREFTRLSAQLTQVRRTLECIGDTFNRQILTESDRWNIARIEDEIDVMAIKMMHKADQCFSASNMNRAPNRR